MPEFGLKLSEEELKRYGRQIILPEVGEEGQKKIKAAKVLLMGAGGLGSAASFYLVAAGVGKIGIIDSDLVELSNLNRQILHKNNRIGRPKAESARQTLGDLNPDIEVVSYQIRLTPENAFDLIGEYDLVVDCSDNFPARFLMNDVCVRTGKPLIYGAISGFEGQAMTILPGSGPCYRCLYPQPPAFPAGQPLPVMGVLPGLIGMVQATEVLKFILGLGDLLVGRLLLYNALTVDFLKLDIKRSPLCPACGEVS
jgi:adenylyltransferase/sulfurtransferase